MPHILLASVFLGMFQWTNYWDFVIYFVVTGGVVLIANIIRFEGKIIRDPGSDDRTGSGDHRSLLSGDPALYIEI